MEGASVREYVLGRLGQWKRGEIGLLPVAILLLGLPIRLAKWRLSGVHPVPQRRFPNRFGLLRAAGAYAGRDGLWLEFGVYRGESINFLSREFAVPLYGFDSFEGLPVRWGLEFGAGAYSTRGEAPIVEPNVTLVKGWFNETLPKFLREHPGTVSFAHIDSDLYSSAKAVLERLRVRMASGSVIVFDEFCGLQPDDEARAFREFLRTTGFKVECVGSCLEGLGSVAFRILDTPLERAHNGGGSGTPSV